MNTKVETETSSADSFKLGLAVLILAGAVAAFYYFADQSTLLRVIGLLIAVGASLGVVSQTATGQRTIGMLHDARTEVRKVVWPTRAETMQTTLLVIIMVIIMAIMLWLIDMFLGWGIQFVSAIGS